MINHIQREYGWLIIKLCLWGDCYLLNGNKMCYTLLSVQKMVKTLYLYHASLVDLHGH